MKLSVVIVLHLERSNIGLCKKMVIWNDFKSNHKISNQIQNIKSHVFQIKSLFFKSNHYVHVIQS